MTNFFFTVNLFNFSCSVSSSPSLEARFFFGLLDLVGVELRDELVESRDLALVDLLLLVVRDD